MILKNTQIIWKLKEGIVLKYGPELHAVEQVSTGAADYSSNFPKTEEKIENTLSDSISKSSVINVSSTNTGGKEYNEEATKSDSFSATQESQTYPENSNQNLVNYSNKIPTVDGEKIDFNQPHVLENAKWQSLPYRLRPKRADVFVDMHSSVDFLGSLVDFLKKKGLDVKEYNDELHYLPSDIILADGSRLIDAGTVLVLQKGKRYVWESLLKEFGARLNAE